MKHALAFGYNSTMTKRKMQVFVSSTYDDLKEERQAAVEAILKAGHIPAGMELFASGDESQWDTIKQWIEESDIFMLILGARYGSIEPKSQKSYIQLEYEYATKLKKPLFAAVMHEDYRKEKVKSDGEQVLELQRPTEYKEFLEIVLSKTSSFFYAVKDVKLIVHESLPNLIRNRDLDGWIRAAEAKTVEDVEQRRHLEQQVRDLQDELLRYTATDESSFDQFAGGDDLVEIEFILKRGQSTSIELPWDEVFRVTASASLVTPGIDDIGRSLGNHCGFIATNGEASLCSIAGDSFHRVQNQFVALGYIVIETAFRQGAETRRVINPGWVTGWRLTERGQRKLAMLTAIRKGQDPANDVNSAHSS